MIWNYKNVKEFIESKHCKLLSDSYKNMKVKLKIKCCNGHITEKSFDSFVSNGGRCKMCAIESREPRMTLDEVRCYIEKEGYTLLSNEYRGGKYRLQVCCDKKHKYDTTFNNFKKGARCLICSYEKLSEAKSISVKTVIENINKEGYNVISCENFENSTSELVLMCDKGHEYKSTWNRFQSGKRCPRCKTSQGESKIKEVLLNMNIPYESQYKFENCKYKRHLLFDFYIPSLNLCIEYDGKQHFEPVNFSGSDLNIAKINFEDTKKRDNIKDEFCKNNNIELLRIPYWEFDNIENIIKERINLTKNFNDYSARK